MIRPSRLIEVDGFPGYYAGDDGQIYTWRQSRILRPMVATVDSHGYPAVYLYMGKGTRRHVRVHRLVCRAFHGEPPASTVARKCLVRHLDGNKLNARPANLAWGSYAQNYADWKAQQAEWAYRESLGPSSCEEEVPF